MGIPFVIDVKLCPFHIPSEGRDGKRWKEREEIKKLRLPSNY